MAEREVKKTKWKTLTIIILTAITVFYVFFVNWSLNEHSTYVSKEIAEGKSHGLNPGYIEYYGYPQLWYGSAAIVGGILLLVTWIVAIPCSIRTFRLNQND
jgi:hypothetical protein